MTFRIVVSAKKFLLAYSSGFMVIRNRLEMKKRKSASTNLGSARAPIDFGGGRWGYRRNGLWLYRSADTARQFGNKFVEVTDQELVIELEKRGYKILYPAQECVDRPNLPRSACEQDAIRSVKIA